MKEIGNRQNVIDVSGQLTVTTVTERQNILSD